MGEQARELAQLLALQTTATAGRRTEADEESTPSSEELDSMSDIGRNLPLTTRLRAKNRAAASPVVPPASPKTAAPSPVAAAAGICSACSYAKDKASAVWDQERARLTAQITALEAQRAETRQRQEAATQALRARYQTMLDESQAALEMQTEAAREQIDRLSDLLRQAQHQLHLERITHRNQQPPPTPPPLQAAGDQHALNEELRETRVALEQASDQLTEAVHKVEEAEARHRAEVAALQDAVEQLRRDRDAGEARAADLEQQLVQAELLAQQRQNPAAGPAHGLSPLSAQRLRNVRGPQDPSASAVAHGGSAATTGVPAANFTDEALRGLLQKLNAVSGDGPAGPSSSLLHGDASAQPYDPRAPPRSSAAASAADAAFEARLVAAEREMKELQDSLDAERRMNDSLRSQLHDAVDTGDEGEGGGGDDDEQLGAADGGAFDAAASRALLARSTQFGPPHGSPAGTGTSPEGGGATAAAGGSSFAAFMRESAAEFVVPEGAGDKVRVMVRRMNDMRKRARAELARLRRVYSTALAREREREAEVVSLRTQAADAREQVQSLREDVSRKAKLLASLKEAKVGDNALLEQAKAEAREHEESAKRLQRAVASKDALARDLKARVEALEEQARAREAALKDHARVVAERSRDGWRDPEAARDSEVRNRQRESNFKLAGGTGGGGGSSGGDSDARSAARSGTPARTAYTGRSIAPSSGDADAAGIGGGTIHALFATTFAEADRRFDRTAVEESLIASTAHLSVSELRSRLRSSEVDRARCKLRLSALKDKVLDLEAELKEVQRERDRASAVADRFEDLKAAVPRKDAIIKNYKAELQRLRDDAVRVAAEHDDAVIEAEKKVRHLQRQVDVADRYRAEAEREQAALRERVMDLEGRAAAVVRPPARATPSAAPVGGTYIRPRHSPAQATGGSESSPPLGARRAPGPFGGSRAQQSEPATVRGRASLLSPVAPPPLAGAAPEAPVAAIATGGSLSAESDAMIGDEWAAASHLRPKMEDALVSRPVLLLPSEDDDEATTATDRPAAAEPHPSIAELPASLEGSIADLADIMNSLTMARKDTSP